MLLGLGGENAALHLVLSVFALVAVVLCTLWAWRKPRDWLVPAGVAMLVLVLTLSWATPWYVLWVLPFAALASQPHLRRTLIAVSIYFLAAFAPTAGDLANGMNFHPEGSTLGQGHARETRRLAH
jgi:hypothetical protein